MRKLVAVVGVLTCFYARHFTVNQLHDDDYLLSVAVSPVLPQRMEGVFKFIFPRKVNGLVGRQWVFNGK